MLEQFRNSPTEFVGHWWQMMVDNLVNPERFYEQHVGRTGIRWEVVNLLVIGLVGAFGYLFAVETIMDQVTVATGTTVFDEGTEQIIDQESTRMLYGQLALPLVGIFLMWLYYTTAFYAGSWLYTGRGTYFSTLKNTAWALTPFLIGNLVSTAALVLTFWMIDIETDIPGRPEDNVPYLLNQGLTHPLMILAALVSIVVIAWVAYLAIPAIQESQRIEREQAMRVAVVPALLHVAYVVWQLLQRFDVLGGL